MAGIRDGCQRIRIEALSWAGADSNLAANVTTGLTAAQWMYD